MKKAILVLFTIGLINSCEYGMIKNKTERFINEVKSDKYTSDKLPELKPDDIGILLEYADDFTEISNFPVNPISSFSVSRFTVGESLLWTIEHIRVNYGNYDKQGFPGFVPQLCLMDDLSRTVLSEAQLHECYNLYNIWWQNNKSKKFDDYRDLNPLEQSGYSW